MSAAFSVAQIAQALGLSVVAVWKRLRSVKPSARVMRRGHLSAAWTLTQLPANMQETLRVRTTAKGYRDEEHLLTAPPERWSPRINDEAVKLAELHPDCLASAVKLQRALLPLLPRLETATSYAEMEQEGLALYTSEFGHTITGRYWRELVSRTIIRDNGLQEWDRGELFLPERLYRKPDPDTSRALSALGLPNLEDVLNGVSRPTPTKEELEFVWVRACDELKAQLADGADEKEIRLKILQALNRFGFLAKSADSLRKTFASRWKAYQESGGHVAALRDGRSKRIQKQEISEVDRLTLIAASLDRGGRISQAWRETYNSGALSAELTQRFIANPASKSHVPNSVRGAIASDVRRLMPLHHGPRRHELAGPHISRDYSGMFAGQVGQMDDVTCPVYYWEEDPTSPSGFWFGRGQLILAIDIRSRMALGFALHSSNVYNMRLVRGLMLRWHDDWGLPSTLYLERGMWNKAKILKGEKSISGDEADASHTELGLREFGVNFTHAKLPRGKIIEGIIGTMQNQMERLPGYAGRDEVHEGFERVKEQIDDVYSGRVHPSKNFFSKAQWSAKLAALLENYNVETQEGDMLEGLSPLETWNSCQSEEGVIHLGEKARYLLAHHKLKMKVPSKGILLRPSLGGGRYCNKITGRFVGQEMLIWVNPDELDLITITSLDKKVGPFVVPRLDSIPAIGATGEQIGGAKAQIGAHLDYAKTLYRTVSSRFAVHKYRKLLVDHPTAELGTRIAIEQQAAKAERVEGQKAIGKVRALSRELKVTPRNVTTNNAARKATGLDLISQAKRAHQKSKGAQP